MCRCRLPRLRLAALRLPGAFTRSSCFGDIVPPQHSRKLRCLIAKRPSVFPDSLQLVARQTIGQCEIIAFESAAEVARNCKISETAVRRLAYGFRTFGELGAMIRDQISRRILAPSAGAAELTSHAALTPGSRILFVPQALARLWL